MRKAEVGARADREVVRDRPVTRARGRKGRGGGGQALPYSLNHEVESLFCAVHESDVRDMRRNVQVVVRPRDE